MDTTRPTRVIVGGTSTLGQELIVRFAASSRVIVASYFHQRALSPTAGSHNVYLDLTNDDSIRAFALRAKELAGSIDTVVFAAGEVPGKTLTQYDFGEIERVMAINFTGQAKLLQALLPALSPKAHLLLVASIAAQKGSYDPIYAAAKGAVLSLVKSLAASVGPDVRVNAISPGLMEGSAMFDEMAPERREHHRRAVPSGKFVALGDVAQIIVDISQGHWSSFNGACLDVNGGQYQR